MSEVDAEPETDERFLCEQAGLIGVIYFDYLAPSIAIIFAISMIPLMYIYIRDYTNNSMKAIKQLYYGGLVLFGIIFIMLAIYAFMASSYCHNPRRYIVLLSVTQQLYTVQNSLLLQLLFFRLWKVLKETSLKFSKCALYSWIIYTALYLSVFLIGWFMQFIPSVSDAGASMAASAGMMNTAAGFWLVFLFIFKLMRVYKMINISGTVAKEMKQAKVLAIITNNTVLTVVSMLCIFLTMLMIPLSMRIASIHFRFLFALISTIDIYSNFWCIFLSYKHFASWYRRICGGCDYCCNACLRRCFRDTSSANLTTIESRSDMAFSSPTSSALHLMPGQSTVRPSLVVTASNTSSPNTLPIPSHMAGHTVSMDLSTVSAFDADLSSQVNETDM